jgi:DNA-binding transcriptional ArsR family regulator
MTSNLQVMKVSGPPLLPILRSENQARLLTAILLSPEREFTLSELAKEVGVSLSTVTREIQRASEAGVVFTRRVGRAKLVSADTDSVLSEPLTRLLLLSFGPVVVVAEELAGIDGIEAAYIFGSWAARYLGQSGPSPQDLDVLIIGSPDRDVVYAAADRIERRVGRPVQVTFRSLIRWNEPGEDSFLTGVRKRPLVPVVTSETESD